MALYLIAGLFLLAGAVFGWITFFMAQSLRQRIFKLEKEVRLLRSAPTANTSNKKSQLKETVSSTKDSFVPSPVKETVGITDKVVVVNKAKAPVIAKSKPLDKNSPLFDSLKKNWMVWLGGVCVGLSGIFLVKYSMDQGLLGPGARISAGIITGSALHIAAEWLRRNKEGHPSFAALAAGGSITLFAALLSALHLYQMLNPSFVFGLLALVAMGTMYLALLHGPVLAAIGILGAYTVPVLIGDGPGGEVTVLVYALIISAAALMLIRYVYRSWLWIGILGGALIWWLLTLGVTSIDNVRGIYLAIFAYLLMAIPKRNWLLQDGGKVFEELKSIKQLFSIDQTIDGLIPLSLLLIIFTQFISISSVGFESSALINWSPLAIILLAVGGKNKSLCLHPWILLITVMVAWLLSQFNGSNLTLLTGERLTSFYWYCLITALIYSGFSLLNYKKYAQKTLWVSLATLAPLLFLTLAYVLTDRFVVSLQWASVAAVLGGLYLTLATVLMRREDHELIPAWLFIGSHLAYSLAVVMFLREASMTLALAVQIISLSWIIKRFSFDNLGLLLKGVVALVILRLSLNPWLQSYPSDIHWSLWTYGGATLCCFVGAKLLRGRDSLSQWAYAATLHLFALTIWAETRFWLYDGNVYAKEYDLIEAGLNLSIFASLALVYHLKQSVSSHLAKIYGLYAKALLVFALFNYVVIVISTAASSVWVWGSIGETKLFNLMLLTFAMPVILGYAAYRYYLPQLEKIAAIFTATAGFIFISLQIRHFWQGDIRLSSPFLDGELYTYSAVWLLMAVAAILGGVSRFGSNCYKAGMLLLTLVIAKLFLVDMSDLEGLLRVASFMGMGLGLLGIAYLHQKLNRNKE